MVPLRHTSPAAPCLSRAQSLEYAHTVPDVSIAADSADQDALDSLHSSVEKAGDRLIATGEHSQAVRGGSFPWSFRQASHDRTEPHHPDDPPDLTGQDGTLRDAMDGRGSTSNP
jgi:hypothetical protein